MHILISTYYFYPELTPRAFRAFELAKAFSNKGHSVTVFTRDIEYNYDELESSYSIKVNTVAPGFLFNKKNKLKSNDLKNKKAHEIRNAKYGAFRYLVRKIVETIYLGGFTFEYALNLFLQLRKFHKRTDLIISVGLPISVHIGTAYFANKSKSASVADYGDPFSNNPSNHSYWHYKYIERFILSFYNYISIPDISAQPAYNFIKGKNQIRVIPQSIDFKEIKIQKYKKNPIPTFCYAGVFYKKIRNPSIFLDNLYSLNTEFKFVCFTDFNNRESMDLISPYIEKLGEKLVLIDQLSRIECIYEMSRFDFLVNQINSSSIQQPSKLIDYALTTRPVFSFSQNSFVLSDFEKFINGDYSNAAIYDVNKHDAILVASQFEDMALLSKS